MKTLARILISGVYVVLIILGLLVLAVLWPAAVLERGWDWLHEKAGWSR